MMLIDHATDHARLLREAQALARLSHPNVVQIYEVGESHGQIFVAMEHMPDRYRYIGEGP